MLEKLWGRFNKLEEAKRMALKPDEPDQPRNMANSGLEKWMQSAKEDGLEGETSQEAVEFSVADLPEVKPHPYLELVVDNTKPVEVIDQKEKDLETRLASAKAKVETAKAEFRAAQQELLDYQAAKGQVERVA